MSIDQTPNIAMDILNPDQGSGDVTNTQQVYVSDTLIMLLIKDIDLTAPPGGEADGDRYVVASGGTGVWLGLDGKIVTYRDATGQWQVDLLKKGYFAWIEDDTLPKVFNGTAWETLEAGIGIAGLQIYHVGKHGSDTNTGKNDAQAFLTFGKAVTEATAQTPAANNRFVILCHDAGIYAEDTTLPQYVSLYAPNATIVGFISFTDDCSVNIHRVVYSGAAQALSYTGTTRAILKFDTIICDASGGRCIKINGTGELNAIGNYAETLNGAVFDPTGSAGTLNIKCNEVYTDSGTGFINSSGSICNFNIGKLTDGGSGIAIKLFSGAGVSSGTIGYLNCNVAYDIQSNATLNIFVGSVIGTKTVAGTLNESEAGLHLGELSCNFVAPSGRLGVSSPYAHTSATNIFPVNASGKIPGNFLTLIKASIRFEVQAGDPTNTVSATLHHGTNDEPTNQHTASGNPAYAVSAVGDIAEVDITSLFSAIAAGDSFGVEVQPDAGATTLYFYTLDLEFTKKTF